MSPTFIGNPSDFELANRAWRALTSCTSVEPRINGFVPIVEDVDGRAPLGGGAYEGSDSLEKVILRIDPDNDHRHHVIAHELAHAWTIGRDAVVAQGIAELLVLCAGTVDPAFADTPNISRSAEAEYDASALTRDTELGFRLLYPLYVSVSMDYVTNTDPDLGPVFRTVDDIRASKGAYGRRVRAATTRPRAAERWLADADLDGMSRMGERLLDTNARVWDSDGDGWWDGAIRPPVDAQPLRHVARWGCAGFRYSTSADRQFDQGGLWIHSYPHFEWARLPNEAMLVRETGLVEGGAWIGRRDLPADDSCVGAAGFTVVFGDSAVDRQTWISALSESASRKNSYLGSDRIDFVAFVVDGPASCGGGMAQLPSGTIIPEGMVTWGAACIAIETAHPTWPPRLRAGAAALQALRWGAPMDVVAEAGVTQATVDDLRQQLGRCDPVDPTCGSRLEERSAKRGLIR